MTEVVEAEDLYQSESQNWFGEVEFEDRLMEDEPLQEEEIREEKKLEQELKGNKLPTIDEELAKIFPDSAHKFLKPAKKRGRPRKYTKVEGQKKSHRGRGRPRKTESTDLLPLIPAKQKVHGKIGRPRKDPTSWMPADPPLQDTETEEVHVDKDRREWTFDNNTELQKLRKKPRLSYVEDYVDDDEDDYEEDEEINDAVSDAYSGNSNSEPGSNIESESGFESDNHATVEMKKQKRKKKKDLTEKEKLPEYRILKESPERLSGVSRYQLLKVRLLKFQRTQDKEKSTSKLKIGGPKRGRGRPRKDEIQNRCPKRKKGRPKKIKVAQDTKGANGGHGSRAEPSCSTITEWNIEDSPPCYKYTDLTTLKPDVKSEKVKRKNSRKRRSSSYCESISKLTHKKRGRPKKQETVTKSAKKRGRPRKEDTMPKRQRGRPRKFPKIPQMLMSTSDDDDIDPIVKAECTFLPEPVLDSPIKPQVNSPIKPQISSQVRTEVSSPVNTEVSSPVKTEVSSLVNTEIDSLANIEVVSPVEAHVVSHDIPTGTVKGQRGRPKGSLNKKKWGKRRSRKFLKVSKVEKMFEEGSRTEIDTDEYDFSIKSDNSEVSLRVGSDSCLATEISVGNEILDDCEKQSEKREIHPPVDLTVDDDLDAYVVEVNKFSASSPVDIFTDSDTDIEDREDTNTNQCVSDLLPVVNGSPTSSGELSDQSDTKLCDLGDLTAEKQTLSKSVIELNVSDTETESDSKSEDFAQNLDSNVHYPQLLDENSQTSDIEFSYTKGLGEEQLVSSKPLSAVTLSSAMTCCERTTGRLKDQSNAKSNSEFFPEENHSASDMNVCGEECSLGHQSSLSSRESDIERAVQSDSCTDANTNQSSENHISDNLFDNAFTDFQDDNYLLSF